MNILVKPALAVFAACLMLSALAVTADESNKAYKIRYLKDCDVVAETQMTSAQISAYLELEAASDAMKAVEPDTQVSDERIDKLSREISKISKIAHQEIDGKIIIDTRAMQKQDELSKELGKLMDELEPYYNALGEQGDIIGKKADVFDAAIKSTEPNVDYDQVRIISPKNERRSSVCLFN